MKIKGRRRKAPTERVPQREVEIIMLFKGGCSMTEIGEALGITRERVRQLLKRHDLTAKDGFTQNGWRHESLVEITPRLKRASGIEAEESAESKRLKLEWRWRVTVRVIQELASDLGKSPNVPQISRAMGVSYGRSASAHGPMFLQYLTFVATSGHAYAATMARLFSDAGVPRPGRGAGAHAIPGHRHILCKRGHVLAETRTSWGSCRLCEAARSRRRYAAKKARSV